MKVNMWKKLHRIFVLLRFDIKNKNNSHVIDIIIKAIINKSSNQEMFKMIFYIMPSWKSQLIVERDDEQEIICNTKLEQFIIRSLELMKTNISIQKYKMAYDIADTLHVLPEIVIANQKKGLKQYWKIYVKPFQKKWRCNIFDEFKVVFMR
ncbi:MAG: hypothetical protein HDT30_06360 [Clostridiales bacterium]|nr:hypothetical protein [Clostridiales bacterium]